MSPPLWPSCPFPGALTEPKQSTGYTRGPPSTLMAAIFTDLVGPPQTVIDLESTNMYSEQYIFSKYSPVLLSFIIQNLLID